MNILALWGRRCSPADVCEQSIDGAKAPSRRWDNGWSCCWRSEPRDLFHHDWQSRERIRKQNERVSDSTYQTSQTLQTGLGSFKRCQFHSGSLQRGGGVGNRMKGWEDTGGWLIGIVAWTDGPMKGFALAGSKCVACWVISQYGFHLINPPGVTTCCTLHHDTGLWQNLIKALQASFAVRWLMFSSGRPQKNNFTFRHRAQWGQPPLHPTTTTTTTTEKCLVINSKGRFTWLTPAGHLLQIRINSLGFCFSYKEFLSWLPQQTF